MEGTGDSPGVTGKRQVFIRDATGLRRELSTSDVFMFNVLCMGIAWAFIYIFFAAAAYPGADLPMSMLLGLPPNLVIALLYYYLSVALPRTGGDYVWCTRLVHPAIGFMQSFAVVLFWLSYSGPVDAFLNSYGISGIFTNLSIATGNTDYLKLAAIINSPTSVLIGSLGVVVVVTLFAAFGLRNTFRFQWATFIAMSIGVAAFAIALATSSPEIFKSNFNTFSGANYDGLISAAHNAGFSTDFTIGGTILGSLYAFTSYAGYNISAYLGGEVKQARKSQFIGIVIGVIVFGIVMTLLWAEMYWIMGGTFISAVSQLASASNSAYTLPMAPVMSYLVMFANSSPIVGVLVPLSVIVLVIGSQETVMLFCVRIIFSWSFDGVTPAKLASVSDRNGSPNYALAVVAIIMGVYVLISNFAAGALTVLAYTTSGIYLAVIAVGVAGITLPYKHKELFTGSPDVVQRKLGGVPIVAILGFLTVIIGIFVAAIGASPIFTGAPVNPYYILGMISIFIGGLLIYEISVHYQNRKGVEFSLRFKEIPPE